MATRGVAAPARGVPRTGLGLARWVRRRPVIAATLAYAVLAAAFLGPGIVPGHTISGSDLLWTSPPWSSSKPASVPDFGVNGDLADPVDVFQPQQQQVRSRLPGLPLWNPYIQAGRPLLANQQSAVFSPFSLPVYVLPFWWALSVAAALKILVACLGTFLLARALGIRDGPAFVAGLAFGFGLFFVVWLPWPLTSVWALLPWLLWASDRLVRAPGLLSAALLAALVGVQFLGGHPESSFHVLFATVCFFVLRLLVLRGARGEAAAQRLGLPAAAFAGALVVGTALAALTLIPFLELVNHSRDLVHREEMGHLRLDRRLALGLFLPDYWGRPTQIPLAAFEVDRGVYLGALPLVFGLAALVVRPTRQRVAIALFGAAMLAVTFGVQPVFGLFNVLPGFSHAYNTRLPIVALLCLALLAAWGVDDLAERWPAGRRGRVLLAAAVAAVAVPAAVVAAGLAPSGRALLDGLRLAWGFVDAKSLPAGAHDAIHLNGVFLWLSFGGLAVALLFLRARGRLPGPALVAAAALVVAAELFRVGVGENPSISTAVARQPVEPSIHYLRARAPARFVGITPVATFGLPLPADVAMRYRLYDARSYDYPVEERYDRLWREELTPPREERPPTTTVRLTPRSLRILSLFGVRSLIQEPGGPPLPLPGLRVGYDGRDARVFDNPAALPRAGLVAGQWVVGGQTAERHALGDARFNGRRAVVVARPLPGLSATGPQGADPPGRARLTDYGAQRVRIAVDARSPGELVLTDVFYPGWKATVDGRPARLDRVDYLFRGVPVPAGRHRVELRYRPSSWRAGWIVSLAAALALVAGVAAGWRARRRRAA